jgi:hypothetical protein
VRWESLAGESILNGVPVQLRAIAARREVDDHVAGEPEVLVSLEDEADVGFAIAQINRASFRGRRLRAQPTRRP